MEVFDHSYGNALAFSVLLGAQGCQPAVPSRELIDEARENCVEQEVKKGEETLGFKRSFHGWDGFCTTELTGDEGDVSRSLSIEYPPEYKNRHQFDENSQDFDSIRIQLLDAIQSGDLEGVEEIEISSFVRGQGSWHTHRKINYEPRSVVYAGGCLGHRVVSLAVDEYKRCTIPVRSAGGRQADYHLGVRNSIETVPQTVVAGGGQAESDLHLLTKMELEEEKIKEGPYGLGVVIQNGESTLRLGNDFSYILPDYFREIPEDKEGAPLTMIDPAKLSPDKIGAWLDRVVTPEEQKSTCDAWAGLLKERMIEWGNWNEEEASHFGFSG